MPKQHDCKERSDVVKLQGSSAVTPETTGPFLQQGGKTQLPTDDYQKAFRTLEVAKNVKPTRTQHKDKESEKEPMCNGDQGAGQRSCFGGAPGGDNQGAGQKCCLGGALGGDDQGAGQKYCPDDVPRDGDQEAEQKSCLGGETGDGEKWIRDNKHPNHLKKSGDMCQVKMKAGKIGRASGRERV